jgi:hypothetical protein
MRRNVFFSSAATGIGSVAVAGGTLEAGAGGTLEAGAGAGSLDLGFATTE